MSENKSNKKLIIIVLALLLLAAGLFIIKPWNKQDEAVKNEPEVIEPCTDCTVEKGNPFNLTYSGETIKYNAYDFIIEKMSQAQYWTYDEFHPLYKTNFTLPNPTKDETIINGTGWVLYDEDSASFIRGCQGILIINFSENTAISNKDFYETHDDINKCDIFNGVPFSTSELETFDLNNKTLTFNDGHVRDYSRVEPYVNTSNQVDNLIYNEISETFEFYNNVFSELGIPLTNMPKGTLASYKNKTIEVPVELLELKYRDRWGDDLIHTVFDERANFDFYWERNKDNIWLDDYRDIMNKQFPEFKEYEEIYDVDNDKDLYFDTYSPLFLVMLDRKDHTATFGSVVFTGTLTELMRESPTDLEMNSLAWEDPIAGAVATYWLRPLYKQIFGFDGVYFVDYQDLENNPNRVNRCLTKEQFDEGIKSDSMGNVAVPVFARGEYATFTSSTLDITWLNNISEKMDVLCKYYGVESQFGPDFIMSIRLMYQPDDQLQLGLK